MTTHVANFQATPTLSRSADLTRQFGLVGLGACATAQREVRWMVQALCEQGQRLEAALLDNLAQRAVIAGSWVDACDHTAMTWWNQVEQVSRLQFERFLHQCGLATHDDLRALVRKLDDLNLRVADLNADVEKAA
jgi:hypothetical protein